MQAASGGTKMRAVFTEPSPWGVPMNFKIRRLLYRSLLCAGAFMTAAAAAQHEPPGESSDAKSAAAAEPTETTKYLRDEHRTTQGSVMIGGKSLNYQADAGVLVVHVRDPMDEDAALPKEDRLGPVPPQIAEASMSYVAYFKGDKEDPRRPITFLYNGGPGSSTVWLHMGAFGPKRVVTPDDRHLPGAPYHVVDNEHTLLDATDLVFIDAPGTGFGHLRGADKEKFFYGVDQDAHAFANFIVEFLSRHGRWNSPKYVFGESYGTTRSAVLASILEQEKSLDLNGVILLSQILNFDDSPDGPQFNPGVNLPYELVLPTYTATAWYHHKLANQPAALEPLLREVEKFALSDYAQALDAGSTLTQERKSAIAARLSAYTGLPADYIERANLRVNGGEFEKTLLGSEMTTGRLDTRFAIGRHILRVRVGLQRLRQEHAQVRREHDVQARDRRREDLGIPASAARRPAEAAPDHQCRARSRGGDEAEPEPQGAAERRILRSGHPVLRGGVRIGTAADPGVSAGQHRDALLHVGAHGLRA
jgi:carboxypeptidase C (cathepsin A)